MFRAWWYGWGFGDLDLGVSRQLMVSFDGQFKTHKHVLKSRIRLKIRRTKTKGKSSLRAGCDEVYGQDQIQVATKLCLPCRECHVGLLGSKAVAKQTGPILGEPSGPI